MKTPFHIRTGYILMGVAAMAGLLGPCLSGISWGFPETMINVALATLGVSCHLIAVRERNYQDYLNRHGHKR